MTSEAAINDSAVHEIDVTRWLLDEEITSVMVLAPRRSPLAGGDLQDPMVIMFRTASGVLVDDELGLNVQYGYDIRAEVVGETGQARLPAGRSRSPPDWRVRFVDAYDTEFRAWIGDVAAGREPGGPTVVGRLRGHRGGGGLRDRPALRGDVGPGATAGTAGVLPGREGRGWRGEDRA